MGDAGRVAGRLMVIRANIYAWIVHVNIIVQSIIIVLESIRQFMALKLTVSLSEIFCIHHGRGIRAADIRKKGMYEYTT